MKRICVYAGSNAGNQPVFEKVTKELGKLLASEEIELVYGGSKIGLMGCIADTVLAHGGRVTGVMPTGLFAGEMVHRGLTNLYEVRDMHERKAKMSELADAYITLPGGLGTLEELLEVLSWAQLGIHQKPIGILNAAGYYDSLAQMFEQAVAAGFMQASNLGLLRFEAEPAALLDQLRNYEPPVQTNKWAELPDN